MFLNRRAHAFRVPLWCLLLLWLFFGCLELAEELQFVSEIAAEDQEHQDLDEEALLQLASGLKADSPSLGPPDCASVTAEIAQLPPPISLSILRQLKRLMLFDPPPLRLHQQLSVYRI